MFMSLFMGKKEFKKTSTITTEEFGDIQSEGCFELGINEETSLASKSQLELIQKNLRPAQQNLPE